SGTFSLIFDIWTSNNLNSFFGIILSYINTDFKLRYKLIGFHNLTENHTGLYLYNEFINILNEYQCLNVITTNSNILSITRDNASNNNKFIKKLRDKNKAFTDIRCIAHILNLVVQDILSNY